MSRVERIRLYPTASQAAALVFALDVTRDLYNALLQQRRDAYRLRGVRLSSREQYAAITALRAEDARAAAVYRDCEDAVLHRLDLAFAAFFRRLSLGQKPGYPRYRSIARWRQLMFSHGARALKFNGKRVRIPGVGFVRYRKGRDIPPFGRAWVVERAGRWYACFVCKRDVAPGPKTSAILGVDRGVHVLAATSQGALFSPSNAERRQRDRVRHHQRSLETSAGRERAKARLRLARAKEREANIRRDRAHKVSRAIIDSATVIGLEKLNISGMTKSARGTAQNPGRNIGAKSSLNRAILDAGFGLLRRIIVAKAEEAARTVVEVDGRFSSRECGKCRHIAKESRRRRRFVCVRCGFRCHADVNAALVIRRRAQAALKSEPHSTEEVDRRISRRRHTRRLHAKQVANGT